MHTKYLNILTPKEFIALLEMFDISLSPSQATLLLRKLRNHSLILRYDHYASLFYDEIRYLFPMTDKQFKKLISYLKKYQ